MLSLSNITTHIISTSSNINLLISSANFLHIFTNSGLLSFLFMVMRWSLRTINMSQAGVDRERSPESSKFLHLDGKRKQNKCTTIIKSYQRWNYIWKLFSYFMIQVLCSYPGSIFLLMTVQIELCAFLARLCWKQSVTINSTTSK